MTDIKQKPVVRKDDLIIIAHHEVSKKISRSIEKKVHYKKCEEHRILF